MDGNFKKINVKKMATIGMLCAIAYTLMFFFRIPIVLFLKYEPKDVIITMGGFLFGPLSALYMSLIVSLIEMFTASDTGIIGCVMNILSSCSLACTASFIYHKRKTMGGAIIGLLVGVLFMTAIMALWNYLITPIYMGYPRQAVAELILPVFIPFNLFKGGLNAVLSMLLFKPTVTALHKAKLIEPAIVGTRSTKKKWIFIISAFMAVTVILLLLYNPPDNTEDTSGDTAEVTQAAE